MQMEFVRGDYNLRARHRGCVAAVGGFDGLHLGHRAVIERAIVLAQASGQPAAVVLFEPLPREFFNAQGESSRLYPLRERVALIAAMGIERVICLRFNARIATMRAEEFIEKILIGKLGVQALVVGEGFRFGHDKTGDVALLKSSLSRYGFTTRSVAAVVADSGERISSTGVREALKGGDFARAAHLLGRDYSVSGRVGHGQKRGSQLGFPTANLMLGRRPPPLRGVFAATVEGAGRVLPGVVNAGSRPTFNGQGFCFEVHLPGFSDNLYGRRLRVLLLAKIRDEQRFDSVDALKSRIEKDIEAAMQLARA